MKTKLTTKDLIAAGAFGAIYLVVLTVLSSMVLPIVPVLFLATPLIAVSFWVQYTCCMRQRFPRKVQS